jgi:hypothetical protein
MDREAGASTSMQAQTSSTCKYMHASNRTECGVCARKRPSEAAINAHNAEIARRKRLAGKLWYKVTHGTMLDDSVIANDDMFIYGQVPVKLDGSVHPPGEWSDTTLSEFEKQQLKLFKEEMHEQSWRCTSCKQLVKQTPRAWVPRAGQTEPVDWWWCTDCRRTKSKPTAKEQKKRKIADNCKKMTQFMSSSW